MIHSLSYLRTIFTTLVVTYIYKHINLIISTYVVVESIYLQEIAMETALRQRQHVLVDGSLSNGEWFSSVGT